MSTYYFIPFIPKAQNQEKANLCYQKCGPDAPIDWGHAGCFWNADNVLFLDRGGDYTSEFSLQTPLNTLY